MDQNPYSAPRNDASQPFNDQIAVGERLPWEPGEVLATAWALFKQHWTVLIGATLVAGLIIGAPIAVVYGSLLFAIMQRSESPVFTVAIPFVGLASYCIFAFLQVGLIRIYLAAVRGEAPDFGLLFSGASRVLPMLAVMFLSALAAVLGGVLFIIPGIIIWLGLANSMFFTADTEMGPVDCLKASWASLDGSRLHLFLFYLIGFVLNLLGELACGVGLLVALAIHFLGLAVIYTRASGRVGPALPAASVSPTM